MTRSPLWCCTSIIRSSALVQASFSLSIGLTRAWSRSLLVTEKHFHYFSREFYFACSKELLEVRVVLLCKDHGNPTLLANYRPIALCNSFYQLINIIITSRIWSLTEKYAVLESSQHGFRGSRSVQLVIQKECWLLKQAMKQDTKLIRGDLDFKNAFNSAGHFSLWKTLQGFGVPDVSVLSSIYEHSTM